MSKRRAAQSELAELRERVERQEALRDGDDHRITMLMEAAAVPSKPKSKSVAEIMAEFNPWRTSGKPSAKSEATPVTAAEPDGPIDNVRIRYNGKIYRIRKGAGRVFAALWRKPNQSAPIDALVSSQYQYDRRSKFKGCQTDLNTLFKKHAMPWHIARSGDLAFMEHLN